MENYIGPHWSDGKWQESVEFGNAPALSEVDAASRLHDSAYAHYKDEAHRVAADEIYSTTLKRLKERYAGLADVPLYGNYTKNRLSEIGSDFMSGIKYGGAVGGLGALFYNGIKGIVRSNDLIQNGKKYRDEVSAYYATDPAVLSTTMKKNKIVPFTPPDVPQEKQIQKEPKKMDQAPVTHYTSPIGVSKLYRPLKPKKRRPVTPDTLRMYLKYHPTEEERVRKWLDANPLK